MRLFFRSLVVLDSIALVLMAMQLWNISHRLNEITQLSEKVNSIGLFVMFILIFIGAIGLLRFKKFGFILYYIQFPIRLYLWVFTLGFTTLLPEALGIYDDIWFDVLLKVCFVGEFIRLYLTIKGHLDLKTDG